MEIWPSGLQLGFEAEDVDDFLRWIGYQIVVEEGA